MKPIRIIQHKAEYAKTQAKPDRVKLVKDFLDRHYEIKVNVFNPEMSYIRCTDANPNKERHRHFPPTRKDIALHLESENIRGCKYILNDILESPAHSTPYNPIQEYLESLDKKWKGDSQIDKLCSFVQARDFGDREDGYYQARFARIFKKWLVACVASWMGKWRNDVILGLISGTEGIGKTSFIEFLMPRELKPLLVKAEKRDENFDPSRAFVQNAFILFDELNGIKKSNIETIKSIMTSADVNIKFRAFPRIANAALATNRCCENGGFMKVGEIYGRRFANIEVESIDYKKYTELIDINQIWAEAYELFQNADFNYVWEPSDHADFQTYNRRYEKITNAEKLITENYRVPIGDDGEQPVFKQASEIIQDLRRARRIPAGATDISEITIGRALAHLGFNRTAKNRAGDIRYGWEVVQLYGKEEARKHESEKARKEETVPEQEVVPEENSCFLGNKNETVPEKTAVEQFASARKKKKPPKEGFSYPVKKSQEDKLCPSGWWPRKDGKCDIKCAKGHFGCVEVPINAGFVEFETGKSFVTNPDLLAPKYRKMYYDYINDLTQNE